MPRRIIVHGQTGLAKRRYLEEVLTYSRSQDQDFRLLSVGDLMYEGDHSIPPGTILSIDRPRLLMLRRMVDQRIVAETHGSADTVVVNSHACFRARLGLLYPGGWDLIKGFGQEMYITIIDDVDSIYLQLRRDYPDWRITLKDILVWREEEILITEMLASFPTPALPHYVVASKHPHSVIHDLIFNPNKRKAYVSFPITLIEPYADVKAEVNSFRQRVAEAMIAFDPLTIAERKLITSAQNAPAGGRIPIGGGVDFSREELLALQSDIDNQIVSRDFKLIDQSDMVVAFFPRVLGRIEVSAGVTMEIQHATETGKEVFVVCPNPGGLSPFITEHATGIYEDFDAALREFNRRGYTP